MDKKIDFDDAVYNLLWSVATDDPPEIREACLHCKAPVELCNGCCKRVKMMLKGEPDPGDKYAGATNRKYYSRNSIASLAQDTGYSTYHIYHLLASGLTADDVRQRAKERKARKGVA